MPAKLIARLFLVFILAASLLAAPAAPAAAAGWIVSPHLWVPNDTVLAMAVHGNTLYIGGIFTQVGPPSGSFAATDGATGAADLVIPAVGGGPVRAIAPDGSGGWYIGGDFTNVGGQSRAGLAHILPDKSLDPNWTVAASSTVYALAVSGGTLYVGGAFTTLGGLTRNRIGAINAAGNVTAWNPDATSHVYALAVVGTTVYAGGAFGFIGGQSRSRVAALDATLNTNNATAWNPGVTGTTPMVYSLAVCSETVYIGGLFSSVGTETRSNIAAVPTASSTVTAWNPTANNQVNSLACTASVVYAGGRFTNIGGQTRNRIAALDTTLNTNNATAWNPSAGDWVESISLSGTTLYIAGRFSTAGGSNRKYLAALDTTVNTNNATAWTPNPITSALAVSASGSAIGVGGWFTSINMQTRNRIAAIDLTTGELTGWNPNAGNAVGALVVTDTLVYAGGSFTTIGGQTRNRIAALDRATGLATDWNPNSSSTVEALQLVGSTLYAGGSFLTIGGATRPYLASLDTTINTNNATAWTPAVSGSRVKTLALDGSTLYAGGEFSLVGSSGRQRLAAFDLSNSGALTGWNPGADDLVRAIAISAGTVYVGGEFEYAGGAVRNYLAALDKVTGLATDWDPAPTYDVYTLALAGNVLYAGGYFENPIGGADQPYLAALDITKNSNMTLPWNPQLDAAVYSLLISGNNIFVGGDSDYIDGIPQPHLARLSIVRAQTLPADQVTDISARLNASLLTNHPANSFRFEWGTTSGVYPNTVAGLPNPLGATGSISVSAQLSGLVTGQKIYYRVVLITTGGELNGEEQSFTPQAVLKHFVPLAIR
jgi:hypothetical protein